MFGATQMTMNQWHHDGYGIDIWIESRQQTKLVRNSHANNSNEDARPRWEPFLSETSILQINSGGQYIKLQLSYKYPIRTTIRITMVINLDVWGGQCFNDNW